MSVSIGVDLSLRATGIVIIDGIGGIIQRELIKTEAKEPYAERIVLIADTVVNLMKLHNPDVVGIEEMAMFASFNSGTLFPMHGAVIYAIEKAGQPQPLRISATTLKKFVTGSGKADKSDMRMHSFKKWGVDFKDDNECDAYACARLAAVARHLINPDHKYELECAVTVRSKEASLV